ncbi:hypothetical protein JTE90_003277 [Oedothorax gibbosus]|uniref:Uncharacterized protein n=1 Tax=Oedothorax gibbosus TaxID=931172 RepID=A0AAV6V6G3_9ARAC|nr:hypothetical protein JTE90_003277 [Oedothorax gibbosus]
MDQSGYPNQNRTSQVKEFLQETKETTELELKKNCSINITQLEDDIADNQFPIHKFSSFSKTCRIMAWGLRFISNCKETLENGNKKYLQTSELKTATLKIIENVQGQEFE